MTSTPVLPASALSADAGEPSLGSAGEVLVAQLRAVRELLRGVPDRLVEVFGDEVAGVAAEAAAVVAIAEAARAAVVLEAESRGVIESSDHPRVAAWVEQSCREGGVPVRPGQARQLSEVAATCTDFDVAGLREAVAAGRVPVEKAAEVAKIFRRLRQKTDCLNWDGLLADLIDCAADGASNQFMAAIEDALIGKYGNQGTLDEEHDRAYGYRELTGFRRGRHGLLQAMIRLDPASEAVFTASIQALSAPDRNRERDPNAPLDTRPVGARRADALLAIVGAATTPDKAIAGSGSKARVVVTMPRETLMSGLERVARAGVGHAGYLVGTNTGGDAKARAAGESGAKADSADGAAVGMSEDSVMNPGVHGDGGDGERGYASTAFNQALSPTEARILACDAQIIPAVLGTKGELLDLGHAKRLITPGLRHALHLRDKGCTFPGCSLPPSWCDGHHLIFWALGGPTDLDNLALLCRHHHTEVHRRGHRPHVHDPDDQGRSVTWTRNDGTPIGNQPRHAYSC